jgi:plastocyanin domain-containing protein
VVFPSLNIKRPLPLNEPVVIEFTPAKAGDIAFACGMNMLKGVVVAQ